MIWDDRAVIYSICLLYTSRRQLIRLLGVKLGGLTYGRASLDLFEDTEEQISLLKQVDHIRHRFGYDAIQRGIYQGVGKIIR